MIKQLLSLALFLTAFIMQAQYINHFPSEQGVVSTHTKSYKDGFIWYLNTQNSSTLQHKKALIRMQSNGDFLWAKEPEGESSITAMAFTSDHKFILACSAPSTAPFNGAIIQKQDSTGTTDWAITISSSSNAYVVNLEATDDIIYAAIGSGGFIGNTYYHTAAVVGISHNGQILWHKKFSGGGLTTDFVFNRTALTSTGDLVAVADVRGSSGFPANGMMVTRINSSGDIIFSKYYDFRTTHTQLSVNGLAVIENDEIVFGGRLMTDQISTYPNKMWLGKLDGDGTELLQKTYHGGEDTGEMLQGLRYSNNTLYASILPYSPFAEVPRADMVATINTSTLSIDEYSAVEINLVYGDPYGQTKNTFDMASNGHMLSVGNFYCEAQSRYIPYMVSYDNAMSTDCSAIEAEISFTDSTSSYLATNHTTNSGATYTFGTTTAVALTDVTVPQHADLCIGCAEAVSVIEYERIKPIKIYPNPAQNYITLQLDGNVLLGYTIIDLQGRTVLSGKSSTNSQIDITSIASGTYLIKTSTGTTELLIVN